MHLVLVAGFLLWRITRQVNPNSVWPPRCQLSDGFDIGRPAHACHNSDVAARRVNLAMREIHAGPSNEGDCRIDSFGVRDRSDDMLPDGIMRSRGMQFGLQARSPIAK